MDNIKKSSGTWITFIVLQFLLIFHWLHKCNYNCFLNIHLSYINNI